MVIEDGGFHPPYVAGGIMDIHKPKAAHSWREFLIELGTIICGILIALGLEQVAEAVHRADDIREARQALHDEIQTNVETAIYARETFECLRPQIEAYRDWAEGGAKPPAIRAQLPRYRLNTWDAVKASALPHMPLKERLALGSIYGGVKDAETMVDEQRASMLVLFGAYERKALTAEDRARVLDAVGVERRIGHFQNGQGKEIIADAAKMGILPRPETKEDRDMMDWVCGRRNDDPSPAGD